MHNRDNKEIKMKTGFSRICINPPLGVPMVGYYEERRVKGIHDDIFASALALDDGERRALIVTVEVCLLSTEQCNFFRESIANAAKIDKKGVFLNCSHTHTGPTIGDDKISGLDGNDEYDEAFLKCLCKVSTDAFANMCESSFSYAEGKAEGISFVRRYRMKDGSVRTNPGVGNPDILEVLGTPNETVKAVRIDRADGEHYVLVNYGLHADCVGGEYISGDWPGVVRDTVEKVLYDTKCIFILGSQGDVNHINVSPTNGERRGLAYDTFDGVPRGFEHALHVGRRIAGEAIGIYGKAEPFTADKLSFASKLISIPSNRENSKLEEARRIKKLYETGRTDELPYTDMELTTVVAEAVRICELENGPESFEFVLSALRIGELTLAGMPGECFTEIGRRIEKDYKRKHILVCCLTNGGDSYFPTSKAYDEGGYEARTSRLKKGGDDIIVNGISALTEGLE